MVDAALIRTSFWRENFNPSLSQNAFRTINMHKHKQERDTVVLSITVTTQNGHTIYRDTAN